MSIDEREVAALAADMVFTMGGSLRENLEGLLLEARRQHLSAVEKLETQNRKQAQTILDLQAEMEGRLDDAHEVIQKLKKLKTEALVQTSAYKPVWEDNVRLNEENKKLLALIKYRQEIAFPLSFSNFHCIGGVIKG